MNSTMTKVRAKATSNGHAAYWAAMAKLGSTHASIPIPIRTPKRAIKMPPRMNMMPLTKAAASNFRLQRALGFGFDLGVRDAGFLGPLAKGGRARVSQHADGDGGGLPVF